MVAQLGAAKPGAFSKDERMSSFKTAPRSSFFLFFVLFFAHFSLSFRLNSSRKLRRALA